MLRTEPDDVTAPDWPSLLDDAISGRLPLDIHFQPIVDLRRGVVCGYEALSRFPAALGLPPDRWFAAADRLGVGTRLEARAVATILSHRAALAPNCFLSLNLSPDAACSPTLQQLLRDEGDLRGVVLEITERSPVEDYDALVEALAPLRALGATLAIDDAGAGYSSMRHIVTLEPQFVKLDRSLVQDLDNDPRKSAAITALGAFAGEVDAWVVAEGVETPGELSALSSLQMPLAQGFLLGRPGPVMAPLDSDLQRVMRERADHGGGVGGLMQMAITVRPGEDERSAFGGFSPAAEVAVRLDEYDRPVALLVRRGGQIDEQPVMCTDAATPPGELALRAMTRDPALRFTPAACCDARGRLLGLVPIERLVESLARAGG
ncbi:MAG TPA: EAL domain-containing protein [Thermoleophilaceae bacterium]|nr:EAL domain-containing protein [Thermoleophilaceae bacterium]